MTLHHDATVSGDALDAARRYERLFIVPRAHVDITAASFQLEMYVLFHRTVGARAGHIVGSAAIVVGLFALGARLGSTASLGVGLAAALALGVWGATYDRVAGACTFAYVALLAGLARALAPSWGDASAKVALALVAGGCALQTLSHMFEDVPTPHSSTERFVPFGTWLRGAGLIDLARSGLMTVGVFFWLELWATPRIIPLQVLHTLLGLGYRPRLKEALDERIAEILGAPTSDWRRPRPLGVLERSLG